MGGGSICLTNRGNDGSITFVAQSGTWSCTTGSKAVEIQFVQADYITIDLGSEVTNLEILMYFKFTSESIQYSDPDDGEGEFFELQNDAEAIMMTGIFKEEADGDGWLNWAMYKEGGGWSVKRTPDEDAGDADFRNKEIRVKVKRDGAAAGSGGYVYTRTYGETEDTGKTWNDDNISDDGIRYIVFGSQYNYDEYTLEMIVIKIDDDTMPTICVGDR